MTTSVRMADPRLPTRTSEFLFMVYFIMWGSAIEKSCRRPEKGTISVTTILVKSVLVVLGATVSALLYNRNDCALGKVSGSRICEMRFLPTPTPNHHVHVLLQCRWSERPVIFGAEVVTSLVNRAMKRGEG